MWWRFEDIYQSFVQTYHLRHLDNLMMTQRSCSEMSENTYQTIRHYIQEESSLDYQFQFIAISDAFSTNSSAVPDSIPPFRNSHCISATQWILS
jgi:hypothetical protein